MTTPSPLSQTVGIGITAPVTFGALSQNEVDYYAPFAGASRKNGLDDCMTCSDTKTGIARDAAAVPAIGNPEAGGYVPFDVLSTGASGSVDYDRAVKESRLARDNPTLLAQNVSRELDVSWHEPVAPRTPAPVLAAGLSVFGAEPPTSTSRHMTTDLRGEAVDRYEVGPPPEGAGISACMGAPPDVREKLRTQNLPRDMQRCVPDCATRDGIDSHHETSTWSNGFWPAPTAAAEVGRDRADGWSGWALNNNNGDGGSASCAIM